MSKIERKNLIITAYFHLLLLYGTKHFAQKYRNFELAENVYKNIYGQKNS